MYSSGQTLVQRSSHLIPFILHVIQNAPVDQSMTVWDIMKEGFKNLTLITDGNPIYNAAQVFFDINDIKFNLHQVIGVKNKKKISKKYRSFKQIEERPNRTYKQNYYGTKDYDKS